MSILRKLPVVGKYFDPEPSVARTYHGINSVRRRASIFYYPIRMFFRGVAKTQHHEIQAIGVQNIPPDGAVFLVGNHPNSLLDFFNLLVSVRHPVATAAKDTITNIPVMGHVLKNYALMVPVSRAQDRDGSGLTEEERKKANEGMVRDAVELLVNGRLFNIYAEGRSTDSRKLNKIKLGFMMLALQVEKPFNYNLNLRIVPYGYFYDRINKFQSSVCMIFGKPFKLKDLVELPEDFLALSPSDQLNIEKKLMVAGKQRLQSDIENLIVTIPDKSLVSLIDDITSLYVLTPVKYMGPYENVREKYILGKQIAESIDAANKSDKGRQMLEKLKSQLAEYRRRLAESRVPDALIRREYTIPALGYNLKSLLAGILYSPLTLFGYIVNFLPRLAGRVMRYFVIEVKKRPKVDGDEQAIIAAFAGLLFTYPLWCILYYKLFHLYGYDAVVAFLGNMIYVKDLLRMFQASIPWMRELSSVMVSLTLFYLMGRLWRFSLHQGSRLKDGLFFLRDAITEIFRKKHREHLRELRYEIIDTMDFIVGDFGE